MVDQSQVGTTFPPFQYAVERAKIRELANVLGEQNPIYHDVEAARAAGHPDLPVPPTFPTLFSFWADPPLLARMAQVGVDLPRVLHGEEEYTYLAPIHAGDTVTGELTLVSAQSRRGMEFINLEARYRNQHGDPVAAAKTTLIVRGE